MLHRILAVALLCGTAAALSAQSNVSFETYADNHGANPGVMVVGDFNNSGKPGLIQCCNSNTQMVFRAGNGDGTFQAPVVAWATPVSLESPVAVDVNGDGNLDLVAIAAQNPPAPPGSGYYYLTVWLGNGDGTFQSPQVYTTTTTPASLVVGNFFADGHPDIAVSNGVNTIDLFRNEGNGTFTDAQSFTVGGGSLSVMTMVGGDFNGTGVTDLAVMQLAGTNNSVNFADPQTLYVLWNDGKGDLAEQPLGSNYYFPNIAVSRLNGDGMMDILVSYASSENSQAVTVDAYYGQGDNTLYKSTIVNSTTGVSPANVYGLAGVDVNGDGYGDIVAFGDALQNCPNGCTTVPAGMFVWLGNPNGSFQQTPQEFITSNDAQIGSFAMADFNRDGMMDFVEAVPGGAAGPTEVYINSTTRTTCGTYTISPSVTVCQPVDNTYSPSPVRVQANSFDTTTVTAMQEYIDNKLVYSEPVTSFNTTFPVSNGTHFFVTKGWDSSGRSFVADRTVTAYTGTPGPVCSVPPDSASICLPAGDAGSSPVTILANGDAGTSVATAAQLYIDGTLVVDNEATCNSDDDCYGADSFVQTTQNLSSGTHDLVFKLWDVAGNVYEASRTITVQ